MLKVILAFGVIWILGELYFNNKENKQLEEESSLQYLDEKMPITKFGNYIAKGTIKSAYPAVIPYLVEADKEALVVDMKVKVYQNCKICRRENKITRCEYEQKFIAFDSHEWNWQIDWNNEDGVVNRNLKKWTLPYESTQVLASQFSFRDSLNLQEKAFQTALKKSKKQYTSLYLSHPPTEINGRKLYLDSTEHYRGNYYYGEHPNEPILGDVKITLRGILSKQYDTYQNFALHGNYKEIGQYHPHHKKYILLAGYAAQSAKVTKQKVANQHSGSTYATRILFRAALLFVIVMVVILTVVNKEKS